MNIQERIHFSRIDSTNSWAIRELDRGRCFPLPTLISAEEQSAGRGQKSRSWHSPSGCLMFSLLFAPRSFQIPLSQTPLIGFAIALAILQTSRRVLPEKIASRLAIHWPNDIFCADAGDSQTFRKLCGILLEGHVSGVMVAGIGLNLLNSAQSAPPELQNFMISLKDLAPNWPEAPALTALSFSNPPKTERTCWETDGFTEPMERFLQLLLDELDVMLHLLAEAPHEIVSRVDESCSQKNSFVTLQTPSGLVSGFCGGLAEDGAIRIDGKSHRTGLIHFD